MALARRDAGLYRRCGCRRDDGRQFGPLPVDPTDEQRGRACPKLVADPAHGSWGFYVSAGTDPRTGKRRQVREIGFPSRIEARKARAKITAEVEQGSYRAPDRELFADYLTSWMRDRTASGLKPSTAETYGRYVRADIAPSALGRLPLGEIKRHHVSDFIRALETTGRGATTIRRVVAVIQSALRDAAADDRIDGNPARGVRLPKIDREEFEPWTPEQVGAFLDRAAEHRLGALFEVAVFTGMRRAELLGLRWSDVDLLGRRLSVRTTRVQTAAGVVETTPKTRSGRRVVELDDSAVGALMAWQVAQSAEAAEWGDAWLGSGWVFTMEDGRAVLPQYASRLFDSIRDRAGLDGLTFHGLRHMHASLLLAAGTDIALVSKRLGHANLAVTSDVYSHLIASASRRAAESAAALIPRGAHTLHTPATVAGHAKAPASN